MGKMWMKRLWEGSQPRKARQQGRHSFGCWLALERELERELGSVPVPERAEPGDPVGEGTLREGERSPVSPPNCQKHNN